MNMNKIKYLLIFGLMAILSLPFTFAQDTKSKPDKFNKHKISQKSQKSKPKNNKNHSKASRVSTNKVSKTPKHKTPKQKLIKRVINSHDKSVHNNKNPHKKHHKKFNYMKGTASYYGENDGFNGRQMANGDIFYSNDVYSAAHPTLPLGTKLKVTNLNNGRTIYVEVRDRMPKHGRVIDLSVAAANYLGMHKNGLTTVSLVKVGEYEFEKNKRYLVVNNGDDGKQK